MLDCFSVGGMVMNELIEKVNMWFEDRNMIAGSTDKDQILKLVQELGELSDHACKGEDIKDCLLYTSPSPRDVEESRMPSSA